MILRLRVSFPPSISPSCGQFRFLSLRIFPPIGQSLQELPRDKPV